MVVNRDKSSEIGLLAEARDLVHWFEHADLTQGEFSTDLGRSSEPCYTRIRLRTAVARGTGRMPRGLFHDLKELREAIELRVNRPSRNTD